MIISGAGIMNNSGLTQNLVSISGDGYFFFGNATAGEQTVFVNTASGDLGRSRGFAKFFDTSNAGSATLMNEGDKAAGGTTEFNNQSSAANATVINEGAPPGDGLGGAAYLLADATAGAATVINNGGTAAGAGGGYIQFFNNTTGADATFINNGATVGGANGGLTDFWGGTMGNATFIASGTLTGFAAGR